MSDKRYWLWFQKCFGTAKPFENVIHYFGSLERLYKSSYADKKTCPNLSDKMIENMHSISLEDMNPILDVCRANNWSIITYEDTEYPDRLRNIFAPPSVLYVDGDISNLNSHASLAIVGTRKASPYAMKAASVMGKGCARCGMIIISGGALGVDSSAHEGALAADGETYAVLGCGLGANYLMQNEDLRYRISCCGALITEYPPGTPATKYTFPVRNRLISGLADGVLVVEAGEKSGSMITASYAASQNKDVFALPSSIFDNRFSGTNKLIDDGAVVATSPGKIAEFYKAKYNTIDLSKLASIEELLSDEYADRDITPQEDEQITFENIDAHRKNSVIIQAKAMALKGNDSIVYHALSNKFEELEAIISRTSLDAKNVLISLTLLELQGLAEAAVGKRYRKKNEL